VHVPFDEKNSGFGFDEKNSGFGFVNQLPSRVKMNQCKQVAVTSNCLAIVFKSVHDPDPRIPTQHRRKGEKLFKLFQVIKIFDFFVAFGSESQFWFRISILPNKTLFNTMTGGKLLNIIQFFDRRKNRPKHL
jgi:hypothetical protein